MKGLPYIWLLTLIGTAAVSLLIVLLLLFAEPARAQAAPCAPKAELPKLIGVLGSRYSEFPIVRFDGRAGEFILTRSDAGRWTLLRVIGEAVCIVATGMKSELDRGT